MASNENILIEKLKQGDQSAFREVVDKHKDMLYSISLKIVGNSDDAEEIAMDAFLKAFEKISSFRGDSGFSTWLYRICYNLSISFVRKTKMDLEDIDSIAYKIEDEKSKDALGLMLEGEKSAKINRAFANLPELDQKLLSESYLEGKKIKELAALFEMTESNIKVKIFRAKAKLVELLELEGEKINT